MSQAEKRGWPRARVLVQVDGTDEANIWALLALAIAAAGPCHCLRVQHRHKAVADPYHCRSWPFWDCGSWLFRDCHWWPFRDGRSWLFRDGRSWPFRDPARAMIARAQRRHLRLKYLGRFGKLNPLSAAHRRRSTVLGRPHMAYRASIAPSAVPAAAAAAYAAASASASASAATAAAAALAEAGSKTQVLEAKAMAAVKAASTPSLPVLVRDSTLYTHLAPNSYSHASFCLSI